MAKTANRWFKSHPAPPEKALLVPWEQTPHFRVPRVSPGTASPASQHVPIAVSALLPLIESFSSERDLVLDPFCGSGSTLVATRHLRRHFIGMELDPTYYALATRRIQTGAA